MENKIFEINKEKGTIKIACEEIINVYKNFIKSENLGMANLLIYYISKNSLISSDTIKFMFEKEKNEDLVIVLNNHLETRKDKIMYCFDVDKKDLEDLGRSLSNNDKVLELKEQIMQTNLKLENLRLELDRLRRGAE
ncbi:MAG: hypothetical protein ACRCSY_01400 [Cetobacterium sp.]